jgi:hypothetical protein
MATPAEPIRWETSLPQAQGRAAPEGKPLDLDVSAARRAAGGIGDRVGTVSERDQRWIGLEVWLARQRA